MLSRALVRRLPVLGLRDFRLLLADRLLAPTAYSFSMVGVSFAVLDATKGSTADLSYVLAALIAPSLVFTLLGGVFADRMAPQRVIIAGNAMIALGEGAFGLLVLTGHPVLWQMVALEAVTGTGMAIFYPASTALLPRVVPGEILQQASSVSRLAMNSGQMAGATAAGLAVAAVGPGWALTVCAAGMCGTIPLMLGLRVTAIESPVHPDMLRELREGWSEVRSRTWLWVIICQFGVILMAWYGSFDVLGPVVARTHLGGPAAWGAITAAESVGLIAGGLVSLRFTPRRPMLFVVLIGMAIALTPLSLAMVWPLAVICVASLALGVTLEIMMIQWTVALASSIPPGKLARVSSYDALGSVMAMPVGALVAGPVAATIGVSQAQYGAAALIVIASALALLSRDIRTMRSGQRDRGDFAVQEPAKSSTIALVAGRCATTRVVRRAASWAFSRSGCRCGWPRPSASMPGPPGGRSPRWWPRRWISARIALFASATAAAALRIMPCTNPGEGRAPVSCPPTLCLGVRASLAVGREAVKEGPAGYAGGA